MTFKQDAEDMYRRGEILCSMAAAGGVFKSKDGWFYIGEPKVFYTSRAKAREGRRAAVLRRKGITQVPNAPSFNNLTSLQQRALRRITQLNGLTLDPEEVHDIITANGYNAAVSYGHMRKAGATHVEALEVLQRQDPAFSVRYGIARAQGSTHRGAMFSSIVLDRSSRISSAIVTAQLTKGN